MATTKLQDGERVVTAWAEAPRGPGWSNTLVWYLVRARDGTLSVKALQPDEQSADMVMQFPYCELASRNMLKDRTPP
jgi:hypothetical protein